MRVGRTCERPHAQACGGSLFTGPFRTAEVSATPGVVRGQERATAHCSPAHQQHRRHVPVLNLINGPVDKPPLDLRGQDTAPGPLV